MDDSSMQVVLAVTQLQHPLVDDEEPIQFERACSTELVLNPDESATTSSSPEHQSESEALPQVVPQVVPDRMLEEVKGSDTAPSMDSESRHELKLRYRETMEPLKISSSSMADESGQIVHGCVEEHGQPESIDTARANKEIKMLKRGLPVEPEAACFVCIDEQRMDLMKVLISGAVDTPYAHGLYQFDIAFPQGYPGNPPNFKLMTTGQGNAYFGPNLYSCGYVCLSVINTWSGDPEEMWNAERSSILQVLLSIQTLVMDCNILEKEPGYSGYEITHPGNIAYCNIVRYLNMKFAILEQLRNPPKEFKEVIQQHFTLKKYEVLETLNQWAEEAKADSHSYGSDEGSGYNPWCSQIFNEKTPKGAWEDLKAEIEAAFSSLN